MRWLAIGLALTLTGCSTLRELTMTKDELRLYGDLTFRQCLGDVVCIVENKW